MTGVALLAKVFLTDGAPFRNNWNPCNVATACVCSLQWYSLFTGSIILGYRAILVGMRFPFIPKASSSVVYKTLQVYEEAQKHLMYVHTKHSVRLHTIPQCGQILNTEWRSRAAY